MIEQLLVKDYILFEQAKIDFKKDMAVITGETGAGKSLLIDAISYLCGARISGNIVRKGKEKATLQMVLEAPGGKAAALLEENGYDIEDELIITRIVTDKGKSKIRINNQPASLSFVKTLTALLIDIHSQMDTISLMNADAQLAMIDRYANTQDQLEKTRAAYKEFAHARNELEKAKKETFSDDELDFVTAQLNEIEQAAIEEDEYETLQKKIRQASMLQKNLDALSDVSYAFKKDGGILDGLYEVYKTMHKNEIMSEQAENVQTIYYTLQALEEELQAKRDEIMQDGADLDTMQEREYLIRKMFRKYGGSYSAMMDKKKAIENKIDRILHRQDVFDKLEKQLAAAKKEYAAAAKALSNKRRSVFPALKEQIEAHAHDLMLEHAVFEIDMQPKAPSADGIDLVDFKASMNPGQPASSLRVCASGGELARLMLSLKVVFQSEQGIDTIIFDEIDTGVSGKVALSMGSKMHALSKSYQVLCITHLPSVAVWADTHFCVSKSSDGQTTKTQIKQLDAKEDLEELSIMASGSADAAGVASMAELKERIRHG
jgi:DNA repair protein RecN (Recombination protein N)